MNFKKSWKRFWTLSRAREGFTLVELIVVIAIMAILAGVAVPAYTGYIKKAEKASDLQLLGAVNTAFGAAVVEQGGNPRQLTSATAPIVSGTINPNTITARNASGSLNIADSFAKYFAGNTSKFKVITALKFDGTNGVFVEAGTGGMTAEAIAKAVERYNKSNNAGKEDETLKKLGEVAGALTNVVGEPNGWNKLKNNMSAEEYAAFLEKTGVSETDDPAKITNAVAMHVANQLNGVTGAEVLELLGPKYDNFAAVEEKYGKVATASMLYGIATGYANSGLASESFLTEYNKTPTGLTDVFTLYGKMSSEGTNIDTYITADEKNMEVDLDGFLAAMDILHAYEGSLDLNNPDLLTDESTQNLLTGILGSSGK